MKKKEMQKANPDGAKGEDEPFDCVFKSTFSTVFKLVIVVLTGDSGVGKSNILLRYLFWRGMNFDGTDRI